jgi:hypothetical protein
VREGPTLIAEAKKLEKKAADRRRLFEPTMIEGLEFRSKGAGRYSVEIPRNHPRHKEAVEHAFNSPELIQFGGAQFSVEGVAWGSTPWTDSCAFELFLVGVHRREEEP